MKTASARLHSVLFLLSAFVQTPLSALTVTAPPAGSTTVQAGNDFATQVIGDAWDMNNPQDVDTDESTNLTGQTFSGGVFSASASTCAASFYPQFMGYGTQTVAIARGQQFPIDTSTYRYFTIKIKTSTAQQDRILFLENGDSYGTGTFGSGVFQSVGANQWTIQTWDLYNDTYDPAQGYQPWTSFPTVQGIRFDPCNTGTPTIQVDWIRLTAPPTAGQMYNVTWSDSGSGPYTVTAIDADNATYTFTSSASGTSYAADLSRLEPGDYHIQVARSGATATSAGVLHVNIPPQVSISSPSMRGEQSKSYAVTEQGGQWAVPMSAADFKAVVDFTNITYSNPSYPGSFSGRPTNNDPEFIMQTTGHAIDASLYRSACFTQEVFGTRSVGGGSVARFFWGVNASSVSTTTDIVLGNGLVEYCLPDLADSTAVPLVAGSPQPWAGSLGYFRMDPDELTPGSGCNTPQTCFDVRLDSVILAPFATANPSYTIQWTVADSDYASGGSIQIFLDPDKTFGNGNEIGIATVPYAAGSYHLVADKSIPNGTYYLVLVADDGKNTVAQYAGGKIVTDNSDVIFRDGFETGS